MNEDWSVAICGGWIDIAVLVNALEVLDFDIDFIDVLNDLPLLPDTFATGVLKSDISINLTNDTTTNNNNPTINTY